MKFKQLAVVGAAIASCVVPAAAQAKTVGVGPQACGRAYVTSHPATLGQTTMPCSLHLPLFETIFGTTPSNDRQSSGTQILQVKAKKGQKYSIKLTYLGPRVKAGHQFVLMADLTQVTGSSHWGLALCVGPSSKDLGSWNVMRRVTCGSTVCSCNAHRVPIGQPLTGRFPLAGDSMIAITGMSASGLKRGQQIFVSIPYRLDLTVG